MSQLFQDFGAKYDPYIGQKVCLATTSYDNPDASYTFSIQRSREALHKADIQTAYFLLQGNCHVDDARNTIVQEFLLSDCTDLVFLDADVSWEPQQLVKLCGYDADIVGGVYPFRRQDESTVGNMPVRMLHGAVVDERGLIEVEGLPAGFMRIRRGVLAELENNEYTAKYWNKLDRRSMVPIMFERTFDEDSGTRWGGDLHFCNKAREKGFIVYAAQEMSLGHTGKVTVKGSLGSAIRKRAGTTLWHVCDLVRNKKETIDTYREARELMSNPFTALEDVLVLCVTLARRADGPIIETGSGLTTLLMAAANPEQQVWCIEHDPLYAEQMRRNALSAGLKNIVLCTQPIKEGWYEISDIILRMPEQFALGLNDGPPRTVGSRMGFFDNLASICETIICDDADDQSYRKELEQWALDNNKTFDFIEPRAALIRSREQENNGNGRAKPAGVLLQDSEWSS